MNQARSGEERQERQGPVGSLKERQALPTQKKKKKKNEELKPRPTWTPQVNKASGGTPNLPLPQNVTPNPVKSIPVLAKD